MSVELWPKLLPHPGTSFLARVRALVLGELRASG